MPGNVGLMQMPTNGSLSIGRGPANDIVLPDPERQLSKNHCVLEDHNGNVVVVDFSTNGTFLNYSKTPLGRTPTPLNNGDILSVGSYELLVEIAAAMPEPILDPLSDGPVSHGAANNAPDPMQLLDDAGPGGDFLDDLLGSPEGPKGPGQIQIADPMDDLLPPLGEEEDPFFAAPRNESIPEDLGTSQSMHNSGTSDSFRPSLATGPAVIPDDWDDDFLSPAAPEPTPPPAAPPAAQVPPVAPPPIAEPAAATPTPQSEATKVPVPDAPPASEQPVVASGDQSSARAFLDALDVEGLVISDEELHTTMGRMGRVMRTMITGLREILMTRTSIKSEFRIEQTMISAGGNNPLKFSISPDQAIEALVKPKARGYLGSETATEQALNDIKAHEVAMVTGMEAALKGILARLDPEVLGAQIETGGGIGSLLKGKKARYWEVYEKMYGQISDQAENDFHELFSREFARAYKEQLDKLK
jgi:type VI secretion system protein